MDGMPTGGHTARDCYLDYTENGDWGCFYCCRVVVVGAVPAYPCAACHRTPGMDEGRPCRSCWPDTPGKGAAYGGVPTFAEHQRRERERRGLRSDAMKVDA